MLLILLSLLDAEMAACQGGSPTPESARRVLLSSIDRGSATRLELKEFEKKDGRAASVMGVAMYDLFFMARARFVSDALYIAGGPFQSGTGRIDTKAYADRSAEGALASFTSASQGEHPARRGDALVVTGSVSFEKRESGWFATGISFQTRLDSSSRDMQAIRNAELAQRKLREDRRLQDSTAAARAQVEMAQRDAAATRSSFEFEATSKFKDSMGREDDRRYYIGWLNSTDVLLFESLHGTYTRLDLDSDPWSKTVPYQKGQPLEGGRVVGGGAQIYKPAAPLRIEVRDLFRDGSRPVSVEISATDTVRLRVTVLCNGVVGVSPCARDAAQRGKLNPATAPPTNASRRELSIPPQSYEQLLQAASDGDAYAQGRVGVMLATGDGATANPAEAVKWFERAVRTGGQSGATAACWLGIVYERGMGVPRSGANALQWYERGAALGNGVCAQNIAEMYFSGTLVTRDLSRRDTWYSRAAALYEKQVSTGDLDAAYQLGRILHAGLGVPRDDSKAAKFLEMAAGAGNADAAALLQAMRSPQR